MQASSVSFNKVITLSFEFAGFKSKQSSLPKYVCELFESKVKILSYSNLFQ